MFLILPISPRVARHARTKRGASARQMRITSGISVISANPLAKQMPHCVPNAHQ